MFRKHLTFRKKKGDDRDDTSEAAKNGAKGTKEAASYARTTPPPSSDSNELYSRSLSRESSDIRHKSIDRLLMTSDTSIPARETDGSTQDPLGLRVIHRPLGERRADVVFVHGLGGSSRMTWSHGRNLDLFWPLKFLPREPDINEARILTFGYNANFRPGSGKNKMSVLDFAKDLLYDLKYSRDNSLSGLEDLGMGERPIIFVVHSMGGLIVKEAYMQGHYDPIYMPIMKSVSSIVFLSTPHRGTNLAETLNRILQVSFVTSPMQFIADLAAGSQTLQKLNEQFRHVAPKLQIVSFYETRPTTMLKKIQLMVLEKDSSVLGYPGEISKPLDADHHSVCKYTSPDDPRYITVRNVLKTLISAAKSKDEATLLKENNSPSPNFKEYLSITESPDSDYNFFRDRWAPGTCSWIIGNETFTGWIGDLRFKPRVLWVNGNAATGKSILSSFLINHLVQLGLPCQYFFMRFTSQDKRGISMLLRSLAYQLANAVPDYRGKLQQLEAAATDLKTADYRSIWQWLFKQALFQLNVHYPIYWVIDGVDEADRPGAMIRLLSELHLTQIPLRVIVVSRKTHEISSAFQKLAKQVHLETVQTEGNTVDLQSYIDHEMDLASDASYKEEITARLLSRAKGNFLWVHLAVEKINTCHTKPDVENALNQLPSGMEALYDRMAASIHHEANANDRKLGQSILGWVTCARRLLSVEELSDALGNNGLLDIHRTIGDLCGGFVTVDHEGKVAMIHETARDYLMRDTGTDQALIIDAKSTNDMLFQRCIARLTDPGLRGRINRDRPPALLDYATTAWSSHVFLASATDPASLQIVVNFLRGPHVLTWIHVAAKGKNLRALVTASRHLTDVAVKLHRTSEESAVHREVVAVFEGWATDLVKVVGKFGDNLTPHPDSIYKLIPPFCPENSMIYQQFGRKESRVLHVSGSSTGIWDDCLSRFSMIEGVMASSVIAAGSRIAILTVVRKTSQVIIYNAATFEEQRRLIHPERVLQIQSNKLGNLLVSYGYLTTQVWDIATGECLKAIKNPEKRPRPHSILFNEKHNTVLVCGEDRCTRSFSADSDSSDKWALYSRIDEQRLDNTTLNFPICSALSPDGNMVAFGYRNHPLTIWELEPPMLLGQCYVSLSATDMTIEDNTWGEVFRVTWHPFSGEVFGLTQVGLLFRWDPYDEEASATVNTGADCLAISCDGSLVATGDAVGTIKIYATADFSLLYQLSSQDPVTHISFSTDSRRLYDIRGSYGNVWEPNTLVRLADCSDHNSDSYSETESIAKISLYPEHNFARLDSIITLSSQSVGQLYCYGTEDGVAVLCEAGRGKICELERLASYMPIEHVAWSGDGCHVAISDLSGRLAIKRVSRSEASPDTWRVAHEFEIVIPPERGHISQLIFHPTGHRLFISTVVVLFVLDLQSRQLLESPLKSTFPCVKWTCHPTLTDTLLGFGNTKVHAFSWTNLLESEVYTYFPPRIKRSSTTSIPLSSHGHAGSFHKDAETLGNLVSNIDSGQILLEISLSNQSGHIESQYLLLDTDDLQLSTPSAETMPRNKEIPYTTLEKDIAARIREPLAFMSRQRLVFLDVDRWICTWRLPTSALSQARGTRPSGLGSIERHYFLPADWAAGHDARLCTISPDGTFFCPRNGEVATVQSSKLRK